MNGEKQRARLEEWRVSEGHDFRDKRHLEGLAYEHPDYPHIFDGEFICTSPLVSFDEERGVAETKNTIYTLGKRAEPRP